MTHKTFAFQRVLFVFKVVSHFENVNVDNPKSVCVCACLSLANDSSETIKVIIIKLGIVTDMRMHHKKRHVNYITELNRGNNKCSVISETYQVCCEDEMSI